MFPQVRVIPPGGPYVKMPWEKIYKVRIATTTLNMAVDLEDPGRQLGGLKPPREALLRTCRSVSMSTGFMR